MNAIRQSVRPKHQVLVVKCYPRYQKNAVDVKPNSSELSYLLYYASTRRSKVQKVTAFLETRTVKDVRSGRIWNVQVTLQILKALVDKSPRDLPLYASCFLSIVATVLHSGDLTMAEESISTFETFCAHHNESSLAADQDYLRHYEDVVKIYAAFATEPAAQSKSPLSAPVILRWRKVGLLAIRAITSSEATGYDGGRQLGIIMPVILQNVYFDSERPLLALQQRAHQLEYSDGEKASKRRMSVATAHTSDASDAHPTVVSGTTADADKEAEQNIGLLALQSLKQIFVANSRGQVRVATAVALSFIVSKAHMSSRSATIQEATSGNGEWATRLIETVARWTPVQDRYTILVTAMETLVRSPVMEANMEQQILLATMIGWLLRSNVNLIGLSVMDVLLSLVQHILLLLQLGGNEFTVQPRYQQIGAHGTEKSSREALGQPSPRGSTLNTAPAEVVTTPSPLRIELLSRLQKCVGDLATHIYYSDQIADMLSALLLRLKPSPLVAMTSAAIDDPVGAAHAISRSANLQENSDTDAFFSFETARITALKAIRDVLNIANRRDAAAGASAVGRNKVGIQVWEGTQWLLRDHDGRVRKAYVDALLIWLKYEMSNHDVRDLDDSLHTSRAAQRFDVDDLSGANLARRAVSSASTREKQKPAKSTFLQLLHLAIFENATQYAESESDILLLHLLLTSLVQKLSINAVKSGLPMVVRLQEEIQDVGSPIAKVHIGSLVHGYFWALSERFDFQTSFVGREIQSEIARRKKRGMWLNKIQVPPLSPDQISSPELSFRPESIASEVVEAEALKPYDGRQEMVDHIASAYVSSWASPPRSPPSSPSRVMSLPLLSPHPSTPINGPQLSPKVKEQMLSMWSKESVIMSCEKETSKTVSLNGSKHGTNRSLGPHYRAANGINGSPPGGGTQTSQHRHSRPPSVSPYGVMGGGLGALQKIRHSSAREGSQTPISSSSRSSTVRFDDLRKVLSGDDKVGGTILNRQEFLGSGSSSESMVSGDFSTSERSTAADAETTISVDTADFGNEPVLRPGPSNEIKLPKHRYQTSINKQPPFEPYASNIATQFGNETEEGEIEDADTVPPVPPIPASLSLPGGYPSEGSLTPPIGGSLQPTSNTAMSIDSNRSSTRVPIPSVSPSETGLAASTGVEAPIHPLPSAHRNSRRIRRHAKGRSSDIASWGSFGSSTAGAGSKVGIRELLGGLEAAGVGKGGGISDKVQAGESEGDGDAAATETGTGAGAGAVAGAGVGSPPY
ncbi:MAG: plasma membrane localization protein [Sclerophora amabilis]|nr:MAG: plasma membrane localization protein [Sclerophora amabilis]